jgi:hypothetical protein
MKIKDWGKGLNLDQPPWELAPGFWSSGGNVRFRNGKAERVGGIASVITPAITPYWLLGYSSGATRYAAYCGLTKAYVNTGAAETEITRKTAPAIQTVSNATRAGTTFTITTGANHGLATGDIITLTGFVPTSYNKVNATITVTGVTTFTYVSSGGGASPATTFGTYSIVYYSGGVTSNFTATADDKWTGGNFNGVVYVNNPVDGLYYWDQAVTGVLHSFPDSTLSVQDAVRHFKNYIFLLAPTTSSVKYRHRVQWSQAADPGSIPTTFVTAATNDAGLQDLVSDGECVDAMDWGDSFIIYKRDKRFRCTYIGGTFVFRFEPILGHKDDGLLAQNCVVNTPKGQVYLTDGYDIRIHQGGESQSLAQGRVRDWLKANISSTNRKRSFVCTNPAKSEVQVWFPESGQSTCTRALVWNWESDTWGDITCSAITYGSAGQYPTTISSDACLLLSNTTPKIGLMDSGTTFYGVAYTTTLERAGMDFDDARYKMISRSMPLFDGSSAFTASIYHGAAATQDASPTYASAVTYTHNTTTVGEQLLQLSSVSGLEDDDDRADNAIALRSIDFDIKTQGGF